MPISNAKSCKFYGNLEQATKDLAQDIGDRIIANQELLAATAVSTEGITPLIEEATILLDQLLQLATEEISLAVPTTEDTTSVESPTTVDNFPTETPESLSTPYITTSNQILPNYGLPNEDATQQEQEVVLTRAGIVSFKGVLLPKGTKSPNPSDFNNIYKLRNLYRATGRSLEETEKTLNSSGIAYFINQPTFVESSYSTLAEIKDELKKPYITDDQFFYGIRSISNTKNSLSTTVDKSLVLDFVGYKSASGNSVRPNTNYSTQAFHIGSLVNTPQQLKRAGALTYSGEELNAIFNGVDYKDLPTNPLYDLVQANRQRALDVIKFIDFILGRKSVISAATNRKYLQDLSIKITDLTVYHLEILAYSNFTVTVMDDPAIITKLRTKFSDAEIIELLEGRTDIEGVWLDAPVDNIIKDVRGTLRAQADTSILSNLYMKEKATSPTVDTKTQVKAACYLLNARMFTLYARDNLAVAQNTLSVIRQQLVGYAMQNPLPDTVPEDQITTTPEGVKSNTSAGTMIIDTTDFNRSFAPTDIVNEIQGTSEEQLLTIYPESIAKPLSEVLNIIAQLVEGTLRGVNVIIGLARNSVLKIKKQLDAFMNKYLTLIGYGRFDSSLLRCAVNFDISLGTDILDNLLVLLDQISQLAVNIIASMTGWISDLLEQVLCIPINLINNILGAIMEPLVSICAVPKLSLGTTLEDSFNRLQAIVGLERDIISNFNVDLIKFRLQLTGAPDKINQFKRGAFCESKPTTDFMKIAMINVRG